MKKKIMSILVIATLAISAFTGCGSSSSNETSSNSEYQKIELIMAVNGTDIQIDTLVGEKFAELVSEASGGNVEIVVFPNDQLAGGNATKGIEMISDGSVDLAAYASSVMSVLDENLLIGTIPWSYNNYEEAKYAIDNGGGDYYAKLLENHNITYLGSFHNGFRQLTNSKHAVKTPEDVKGLKIRVPGGEVYRGVFNAFGADPVAMSWSEVFTAIQQGTLDGQENGVSITNTAKMYEVQDYMTMWNYTYENDLLVANTTVWNALEPKTQELLQEKALEACEWGRNHLEEEEEMTLDKFEELGMQVTRLSDEELVPFKETVADLRKELMAKYGEEACEAFKIK
ncbi:TRAP transporter substrate-binding protein DctP [Tyzzerella sp. An114]|uniref:DctP family TRAP transporter solute-binding subunit n=1 Tax=Tyzzerella sp. An114 TaxID=1965545 RepID=UPI000B43C245|nr:DctP family TRAP transporter solute-binding subunit [Tyzzerella sp. An114]OUQ59560.1 TRAP transporter substrate-binding protein DctP [Tyzzerella sp. An114]